MLYTCACGWIGAPAPGRESAPCPNCKKGVLGPFLGPNHWGDDVTSFETFWRKHEQEIAARCYANGMWASPYEIARAVFEIAQEGG